MTAPGKAGRPLVVGLDGTLIHSSLRWETVVHFIKLHFLRLWQVPFWLYLGRRHIATRLTAASALLDPAALPYDRKLLAYLESQRRQNRTLILLAGAETDAAHRIAAHLALFDGVLPPEQDRAAQLRDLHHQGYEYLGTRGTGRATWAGPLLKAMRPRQWLKNLLVFVPMLAGHAIGVATLLQSAMAFAAFSLCASSAYLLNDALDAQDDRLHPTKRKRPIAAGTLPLPIALAASALLAPLALALCAWSEPQLLVVVAVYFVSTVGYSLHLKKLLMVDIVTLAILYSLRILGGGASSHIEPSFWLLTFSFFLVLSLALLKRHSELHNLHRQGKEKTRGRGYTTADRLPIGIMGINSAFISVLIFVLYFNSENVLRLYRHPAILLAIVPLLVFWLGRLWTLSFRGQVNEDPLLYVSKDRVSLAVIVICTMLGIAASLTF